MLAGLLIGLVALLPARLLLPAPPLAATSVTGSIWQARLEGASLGAARLGSIGLAAQPAALLKGRLAWAVSGAVQGRLWRGPGGSGAETISATIAGGLMPGVASLTLVEAGAVLDAQGRCQSASGQAQVQLSPALGGQSTLAGALRCEAGALALPLASPDGRARLELVASAQGWQARLLLAGASPAETAALTAAGFGRDGDSLVQQQGGRW